MHAGKRSMCGVIVVDVESYRSTCHGRDAYIHDHCLRYFHNYALFYQLLNSNLFTHRMFSFKREASSETYGPRVYFPSYIFRSIKPKTQKYIAAIYLPLLYFAFYLSFITISTRSQSCKWRWRDWQLLFRVVCKCLLVCAGASIGDLLVPPAGLIPCFLTEGNTYLYFAASPFTL